MNQQAYLDSRRNQPQAMKQYTDWIDKQIEALYPPPKLTQIFLSIPRYFSDLNLQPTYDEMKELAVLADTESYYRGAKVKRVETPIGGLNCYLGEILDFCLESMTPKFD